MFYKKTKDEQAQALNKAITTVLSEMENVSTSSDEYAKMVEQLTKLYKTKTEIKVNSVSMDTLLTVGGNLVGIVLILSFEIEHVTNSKALSFIKSKL